MMYIDVYIPPTPVFIFSARYYGVFYTVDKLTIFLHNDFAWDSTFNFESVFTCTQKLQTKIDIYDFPTKTYNKLEVPLRKGEVDA